ncbi:MAG TPA: proton-conducting transporter membrane subunit, partial [Chloroflexota bacterium]|nr:proton-conducting transporter membrane subunit [Chloroflexota bacterium]
LHLLGYVFTNLASFGALLAFQNASGGRELITDMGGFARRAPFAALAMMAGLFSLAGMPLFAGFVTKFYLFSAATRAGLLWLVAIAVINSTISLYYYLLVVYEMYVRTPPGFEAADTRAHARTMTTAAASPVAVMEGAYGTTAGTVMEASYGGSAAAMALALAPAATLSAGNGHAGNGHTTGHNAAHVDTHGSAHGDGHGGDPERPSIPWWKRDITADMPKEQSFPPHRIDRSLTLGLILFMAGVFFIGTYPAPVIDILQAASDALFARS